MAQSHKPQESATQAPSPIYAWRKSMMESELPAATKLVLLALATFMNFKSGECHPSHKTLAKFTSLSRRSIIRQIAVAEKSGWIAHNNRDNIHCVNTYFATTPQTSTVGAMAVPKRLLQDVTDNHNVNDSHMCHSVTGDVPQCHGGGDTGSHKYTNEQSSEVNPPPPLRGQAAVLASPISEIISQAKDKTKRSVISKTSKGTVTVEAIKSEWKLACGDFYPEEVCYSPSVNMLHTLSRQIKTNQHGLPFVRWCVENWEGMRAQFGGLKNYPTLPSVQFLVTFFERFHTCYVMPNEYHRKAADYYTEDPCEKYYQNLLRKGFSEFDARRIADEKYKKEEQKKKDERALMAADSARANMEKVRRDKLTIESLLNAFKRGEITQEKVEKRISAITKDYSSEEVELQDGNFKSWDELEAEGK